MKRLLLTTLAAVVLAAPFPFSAHAAAEEHPAYLHALSDLREARWLLKHRSGKWKVLREEDEAWGDIDLAIHEIKKASIDDGKDIDDHPPVDEAGGHAGRLNRALDLLRKTRDDLSKAEENGHARGLRRRALKHVDRAIGHVEKAVREVERESQRS